MKSPRKKLQKTSQTKKWPEAKQEKNNRLTRYTVETEVPMDDSVKFMQSLPRTNCMNHITALLMTIWLLRLLMGSKN